MVKYIRKDDDSKLLICLILGNQRVVMVPMMSSLLVHVSWLVNFLSFFFLFSECQRNWMDCAPKVPMLAWGDVRRGTFSAWSRWGLLTLSGPRFFRYRKDREGGGFHPPPFDSSEYWYVEYSICTHATIKFFWKKFQFLRVLGLKKA